MFHRVGRAHQATNGTTPRLLMPHAATTKDPHTLALGFALIYALLLGVWFTFSNTLVKHPNPEFLDFTDKDVASWVFLVLTASALYFLLRYMLVKQQQSENGFYRLFLNSPIAVAMSAFETGRVLDVNDRFGEFLGYRREELMGRTIDELDLWGDPEDRERMAETFRRDGSVRNLEVRFRRKGGERRIALASLEKVAGEGKTVVVAMFTDITEAKRAAEELRESELRFRQMAENIREVFYLIDPKNTQVFYVSPGYEQIWGRSCESLYADPFSWEEAIHPDDRERVYTEITPRSITHTFDIEYRIVRPDGSICWIRSRGFPIRSEAGAIYRVAGVAEDITARKLAEDDLRESERRFSDMLRNVELISLMLDRQGLITYCNDYLLRLTGWQREEVLGGDWFEIFLPPEASHVKLVFEALIANMPEAWHYENDIVTRAGERRLIHWNNSVLRSASGDVIGTASIGEDITERVRSEATLREYTGRLQTLSHRLLETQENERQHIARELHDQIGQALTAVQINLQTELRRNKQGPKSRIADSIAIVEQTLEQVRNLSLDLRPPMLDDLGLVSALRWYVLQQVKRAGLKATVDADPVEDWLDATGKIACFRVTQEALTNIVRHARAHSVSLRLWHEGNAIHLVVRDDGVGFDLHEFRDSGKHRPHLGLIGMEERASLVGGRLEIHTAPGAGTELRLRLPVSGSSEQPASDAGQAAP